MQSRKLGASQYNKDGTLKQPSRKPRTYDEATAIREEKDLRRTIDKKFRGTAIKIADVAAKIPDVMPFAPTAAGVASAIWKNNAPEGSEYYKPNQTLSKRMQGTLGSLFDVAVAHRVGKWSRNPVVGFFGGMGSGAARSAIPSAAKGGISKGGLTRVHNKELIVSRKTVKPLIKLMKKSGVALPLNAIRAKTK